MGRTVCRSRNFLLLWQSQFVGDLGGNVSAFALPAMLVLTVRATPLQVGALEALTTGMIPLCALGAGIVADRCRHRPLLVAANVVRLTALATIPLAFLHGIPPLWLFFAVAAIVAGASSVFDTAYAAFVPSVVGAAALAEGTAKLSMGTSAAEAAGAGIGGALVTLAGAPFALLVNVATFAFSAASLAAIRVDDAPRARGASLGGDLRDGIAVVLREPMLRAATLSNALAYFGGGTAAAVSTVFVYREAHLTPLALAIVMTCGNAGALAAWSAARIARRAGVERTMASAHVAAGVGNALLPLFAAMVPLAALFASRLMLTASGPLFGVNDATLRASLVPAHLLGRATATARTIVWGALPAGALLGGYLGGHIGLGATMLLGAAINASAAAILLVPRATRPRRARSLAAQLVTVG